MAVQRFVKQIDTPERTFFRNCLLWKNYNQFYLIGFFMDICSLIKKNITIMTSTIIIPNEAMLSVPIPPSYIGKEVEVTYTLVNGARNLKSEMKLSDMFRGVFSKEDAKSFVEHTKTMRNEWTGI